MYSLLKVKDKSMSVDNTNFRALCPNNFFWVLEEEDDAHSFARECADQEGPRTTAQEITSALIFSWDMGILVQTVSAMRSERIQFQFPYGSNSLYKDLKKGQFKMSICTKINK